LAAHPIKIDTKLFGLFALSDFEITYYDNFIMVGATPTFYPPRGMSFEKPKSCFTKPGKYRYT